MSGKKIEKKSIHGCPRGVVLAATAPFWRFLKIAIGALVTIYFKIEKNFRKQKSSTLMRSICALRFELQPQIRDPEPKNWFFTGFYYLADIDEAGLVRDPFLVPSWHPKTKSRVSNVC